MRFGMAWRWVASAMLNLHIICYEGGDLQASYDFEITEHCHLQVSALFG